MGEGIVAAVAFVVFLALLVSYALVSRRTGRNILDAWRSAPPPEGRSAAARAGRQTPPEELFDPDRGHGGIGPSHHGDQRTFGGYGSDTAAADDAQSRGEDDRRRDAA